MKGMDGMKTNSGGMKKNLEMVSVEVCAFVSCSYHIVISPGASTSNPAKQHLAPNRAPGI